MAYFLYTADSLLKKMLSCSQCKTYIQLSYLNPVDGNKCISCQIDNSDCDQLLKQASHDMRLKKENEVLNSLNSIIDIIQQQSNKEALPRLYLEIAKVYKMNKEYTLFMKYLKLSAELGHPDAQFNLGLQYKKNDDDLALDFFLKSADQNVSNFHFILFYNTTFIYFIYFFLVYSCNSFLFEFNDVKT